jgi:hypothetical protein
MLWIRLVQAHNWQSGTHRDYLFVFDFSNLLFRAALEKADVLLNMKHGIVRLDNIWGVASTLRPVKFLIKKIQLLLKEYLSSGDIVEATRCLRVCMWISCKMTCMTHLTIVIKITNKQHFSHPGVNIIPKECRNMTGRIMAFWGFREEYISNSTHEKILGRIW